MAEFSFIHSSDLHLGKKFKSFPDEDSEARTKLRSARSSIINNLVKVAEENNVAHILLAGDTFDAEIPSEQVITQTIDKMKDNNSVHWWIITGNHDSLDAEILWEKFETKSEPFSNIHFLENYEETKIENGVFLYPCSLKNRFISEDPTNWIPQRDNQNAIRIGLAHGSAQNFSRGGESNDIINPDRANISKLDYLALGDWHGQLKIKENTYYSGTPEYDNFVHSGCGTCLKVTINSNDKENIYKTLETGKLNWQRFSFSITPEKNIDDVIYEIKGKLQSDKDNTLVQINLEGRVYIHNRSELLKKLDSIRGSFCYFEVNHKDLITEFEATNIDQIATSGALRVAAEALYDSIQDLNDSKDNRDIAGSAFNRLYTDKESINDN